MRELTADAVIRLATAALERTAFLMAESGGEPHGGPLPPASRFAVIDYRGPEEGRVVLAASEGFLRLLAAGMLGCDPAHVTDDESGREALRELANVVAGSLVFELGGQRCPFSLGLPSLCERESVPTIAHLSALLDAEGERLEVHWIRSSLHDAA